MSRDFRGGSIRETDYSVHTRSTIGRNCMMGSSVRRTRSNTSGTTHNIQSSVQAHFLDQSYVTDSNRSIGNGLILTQVDYDAAAMLLQVATAASWSPIKEVKQATPPSTKNYWSRSSMISKENQEASKSCSSYETRGPVTPPMEIMDETKRILPESRCARRPLDQVEPKSNRVVATFSSIRHAGRMSGVHRHWISSVLKGQQEQAGGFYWRYRPKEDSDCDSDSSGDESP